MFRSRMSAAAYSGAGFRERCGNERAASAYVRMHRSANGHRTSDCQRQPKNPIQQNNDEKSLFVDLDQERAQFRFGGPQHSVWSRGKNSCLIVNTCVRQCCKVKRVHGMPWRCGLRDGAANMSRPVARVVDETNGLRKSLVARAEGRRRTIMPPRRLQVTTEPRILGVPFRERSRGRAVSLLDPADSAALAAISTIVQLPKGAIVYRARAAADSIYNLVQGVVKTYDMLPDDRVAVSGFQFAGDLFGLAEQGRHIESAEAIIPSVAFRIPLDALESLLARNGALGLRLLCKAADGLRQTRRHARILARNDAVGRFAMFLRLLEEEGPARGPGSATYFPMSRGDAAQFIGLTLEAMSRASSALERARVVKFHDRHHFQIADRAYFEQLLAGTYQPTAARAKPRTLPGPAPRKRTNT
jgi:CRP-like cAMP-binding protein